MVVPASPDVQLLGDAAVFRGAAALDVYRVLLEGVRLAQQRDAIGPSPRLQLAIAVLKSAALDARAAAADMSDMTDVRGSRTSASSVMSGEVLGIEEVARMCGVGHRQARRLASDLGGWRTSKGWKFDRGLVQTYLDTEGTR